MKELNTMGAEVFSAQAEMGSCMDPPFDVKRFGTKETKVVSQILRKVCGVPHCCVLYMFTLIFRHMSTTILCLLWTLCFASFQYFSCYLSLQLHATLFIGSFYCALHSCLHPLIQTTHILCIKCLLLLILPEPFATSFPFYTYRDTSSLPPLP